ncbi:flagellar type III secretion system pore protein FliP [Zooshikella marina]|uniref:Flagellar biosynthetic protein FliP n=1 Tax=Zooshikella ganghwensis TaxID=202772 RepID=A0A4P9VVP6_9GAMM|nr:flagellar type III secretion system pore protein FliP [Zooshikella ganghwensis]MBU2705944.1 flagellar type III secretion system pore protein FliP [Zooshikella ganghwensis]RDH46442.1 flagellar biosynthetic protein FliP [Zooshikella ganghwensis]
MIKKIFILLILLSIVPIASSSEVVNISGLSIGFDNTSSDLSSPLQVILLLTVLSLAPALLMMLTSFTRIIIVLSMMRHALGLQQTPPNNVLIALALFLTFYTMQPVWQQVNNQALQPLKNGEITSIQAAEIASQPIKQFLLKHTREQDLAMILELSGSEMPNSVQSVDLISLVPAFLLSELQTAFQIGFIIFLPFLLIDLLISSTLMSVGMIMLPPMMISLPIKLLVFVLIDGWSLITYALVGSFF